MITKGKLRNSQGCFDFSIILDIAIQISWGLEALHEFGIIHKDLRAKNILLTKERVVKICDFGLSLRYCDTNKKIDQTMIREKRDLGSLIVQMLNKQPEQSNSDSPQEPCIDSKEQLDEFISENDLYKYPTLRDILTNCKLESTQKIDAMQEVTNMLKKCYSEIEGKEYSREKTDLLKPSDSKQVIELQKEAEEIFLTAQKEAERWKESEEVEEILKDNSWKVHNGSPHSQKISGIIACKRAINIWEILIKIGKGQKNILSSIYDLEAKINNELKQYTEALRLNSESIDILKKISDQNNQEEKIKLFRDLADYYNTNGCILYNLARYEESKKSYDDAINNLNKIDQNKLNRNDIILYVTIYIHKGKLLLETNEYFLNILEDFICSIDELISKIKKYPENSIQRKVVSLFELKAKILEKMKKYKESIEQYNQTIKTLEKLIKNQKDDEEVLKLKKYLVICYGNKADVLKNLDSIKFIELYDKAIKKLKRLIKKQKTLDIQETLNLKKHLAIFYGNKANLISNSLKSIQLYDNAIKILEELIQQNNRLELRKDLAFFYYNKGEKLRYYGKKILKLDPEESLKSYKKAMESYKEAHIILKKLVDIEKRMDLQKFLTEINNVIIYVEKIMTMKIELFINKYKCSEYLD